MSALRKDICMGILVTLLVSCNRLIVAQEYCLPPIMCSASGLTQDNITTPNDNIACPGISSPIMASVGRIINRYAYAQNMIPPMVRASYQDFIKAGLSMPRLGLCDFDCDRDDDCAPGLWCADAHKPELISLGYDPRKVNCGNVGRAVEEVCFDKNILIQARRRSLQNIKNKNETAYTKLLTIEESFVDNGTYDEEQNLVSGQNERKLLACTCSDFCKVPKPGTRCQFLSCGSCRRRLGVTTENMNTLLRMAESELRKIAASWTNITDWRCKDYLQRATCETAP